MSIFSRKKPAPQSIGLHAKASPLTEEAAKSLGIERKSSSISEHLKKISLRERVLIIGLVIALALTAVIYFVILPSMTRISELNEEIDSLTAQQTEIEAAISRTTGYRNDYQLSKQDYNDYQQFFFSYMTPEALDRRVTGMLLDAGLDPTRLSMTSLAVEELPVYTATPLVPEMVPSYAPSVEQTSAENATETTTSEPLDDLGVTESAGSLSDPSQTAGSSSVYVYTIDIVADGDIDGLFSFLTTVYPMHGIEVTNWSYQEPSVIVYDDLWANTGTVNLQIKIYVFLGELEG